MPNSKYDILFIKSFQLSIVSRYGTCKVVAYVDHNSELLLAVIGIIYSCVLVFCIFVFPIKRNFHVSVTILKRACGSYISDINFKKGN